MPQLQSIAALPHDAVDLLEAVGYLDAQELCGAHTQELIEELIEANKALAIMPKSPTAEQLDDWKKIAREEMGDVDVVPLTSANMVDEIESPPALGHPIEGEQDRPEILALSESDDIEDLVSFENDSEVQSMLELSPDAELIPADLIRHNSLAVQDIPVGILLSECQGDVEMNVMTPQSRAKYKRRLAEQKRSGLMTSRIRSFDEAETEAHHVKPLDKGKPRDVVTSSEGLNKGLTPQSRRFVRGVLHPDPLRVRVSAFCSLLAQFFLVTTFVAVPALILYDLLYDAPETIWWVVGIVCGLILSSLSYLFWGISARCRVCGQRQFAPKKCLKNRKAHRIPLIGYIFPTAVHAIFFKWFYCTYCGTAVRLKK
jgi:hypothetical protein